MMPQRDHLFCRPRGRRRFVVAMLMVSLPLAAVGADSDGRYVSVKELGALNGVALQCKHLDQVRRMKAAVVAHAPKERSFGLAFDQATNDAFLTFIRRGEACPSHDALERQVGHAIDRMAEAFSGS